MSFDRFSTLRETIARIREENPDLSSNGWKHHGSAEHELSRSEMTTDESVRHFKNATAFLVRCKRRRSVYKGTTSYGWKHQAEEYSRGRNGGDDGYCSSGMFIAAAIALDFKIQRELGSPNCYLNISESEMYAAHGDRFMDGDDATILTIKMEGAVQDGMYSKEHGWEHEEYLPEEPYLQAFYDNGYYGRSREEYEALKERVFAEPDLG